MYSGLQVRITPGISSFVWQTKIPLQFISQKKFNCRPPDISHLYFFCLGLLCLTVLSCYITFTWFLWAFQVCGKALPCGNHTCEQVCHAGPCGDCPRSGKRSCPCGKSSKFLFCLFKKKKKVKKCHPAFVCQYLWLLLQHRVHKKILTNSELWKVKWTFLLNLLSELYLVARG